MAHALAILPRSPLRGKESRAHRDTHGWRPRQDNKRSQEPLILLDLWLNTALLFHVICQRRGRAAERQIKFSRLPDWLQSCIFFFLADAWPCKARSTCERSDIWGCRGCLFSLPENWNKSWFAGYDRALWSCCWLTVRKRWLAYSLLTLISSLPLH